MPNIDGTSWTIFISWQIGKNFVIYINEGQALAERRRPRHPGFPNIRPDIFALHPRSSPSTTKAIYQDKDVHGDFKDGKESINDLEWSRKWPLLIITVIIWESRSQTLGNSFKHSVSWFGLPVMNFIYLGRKTCQTAAHLLGGKDDATVNTKCWTLGIICNLKSFLN